MSEKNYSQHITERPIKRRKFLGYLAGALGLACGASFAGCAEKDAETNNTSKYTPPKNDTNITLKDQSQDNPDEEEQNADFLIVYGFLSSHDSEPTKEIYSDVITKEAPFLDGILTRRFNEQVSALKFSNMYDTPEKRKENGISEDAYTKFNESVKLSVEQNDDKKTHKIATSYEEIIQTYST